MVAIPEQVVGPVSDSFWILAYDVGPYGTRVLREVVHKGSSIFLSEGTQFGLVTAIDGLLGFLVRTSAAEE